MNATYVTYKTTLFTDHLQNAGLTKVFSLINLLHIMGTTNISSAERGSAAASRLYLFCFVLVVYFDSAFCPSNIHKKDLHT